MTDMIHLEKLGRKDSFDNIRFEMTGEDNGMSKSMARNAVNQLWDSLDPGHKLMVDWAVHINTAYLVVYTVYGNIFVHGEPEPVQIEMGATVAAAAGGLRVETFFIGYVNPVEFTA